MTGFHYDDDDDDDDMINTLLQWCYINSKIRLGDSVCCPIIGLGGVTAATLGQSAGANIRTPFHRPVLQQESIDMLVSEHRFNLESRFHASLHL